ncbi:FHA domain-containing protein [Archangium violaceum]|uniref:FHA domain-containing protein n=1 Tax=Archangium violaceum TaxID=83451 RepID=UPI0019511DBC|nr:FHA domain-containing protein [Archangium violaceum]QRN96391.1 FHA domain-containing protein [Archangium violaceum]
MLTVKELRTLAVRLTEPVFCQQVGPFALVQKPPRPVVEQMALRLGAQRTVLGNGMGSLEAMQVSMLLNFDLLQVATLPPLRSQDSLAVGRLPSCDLVINDPSVSKHHAELRWYGPAASCRVRDLRSTNGTFLNGKPLAPEREYLLRDGALLRFGDADFAFFVAKSLHQKLLRSGSSPDSPGASPGRRGVPPGE